MEELEDEKEPLAEALKKRRKKRRKKALETSEKVGGIFTAKDSGEAIKRGVEAGISLRKAGLFKKKK